MALDGRGGCLLDRAYEISSADDGWIVRMRFLTASGRRCSLDDCNLNRTVDLKKDRRNLAVHMVGQFLHILRPGSEQCDL